MTPYHTAVLSDAEDNAYSRFIFIYLLVIRQKFRKPSFWGVIDSFVLLAYVSLAASRNLLQPLLACLNFTLDSQDLFC